MIIKAILFIMSLLLAIAEIVFRSDEYSPESTGTIVNRLPLELGCLLLNCSNRPNHMILWNQCMFPFGKYRENSLLMLCEMDRSKWINSSYISIVNCILVFSDFIHISTTNLYFSLRRFGIREKRLFEIR
jgi:hypothetical protein